jgi:hypothetical protein
MDSRFRVVAIGFLLTCSVLIMCLPASPAISGSVIGKIAGVSRDAFALQVGGEDDRPFMHFLLTPTTRIDGELAIGANAGVEYMFVGSSNVAIHVMTDSSSDNWTAQPIGQCRRHASVHDSRT